MILVTNWLVIAGLMLSPAIQNLPPPPPPPRRHHTHTESLGELINFALLPHSLSKLTFNTFISTDYATTSGSLKKAWNIQESTRKKSKQIFSSFFFCIRDLIARTVLLLRFTQCCICNLPRLKSFIRRVLEPHVILQDGCAKPYLTILLLDVCGIFPF